MLQSTLGEKCCMRDCHELVPGLVSLNYKLTKIERVGVHTLCKNAVLLLKSLHDYVSNIMLSDYVIEK